MSTAAQETIRRVKSAESRLERIVEGLLRNPGRAEMLSQEIDKATAVLESLQTCPEAIGKVEFERLRSRANRLHALVEFTLAFHCGALLTNPSVEYTYTPAGEMLRAADDANLNLQG